MRHDTVFAEGLVEGLYTVDRELARQWARRLLGRTDWAILDTETTGLDGMAEIVQVAVVESTGTIALDTLVKPGHAIPFDATAIHGITNLMVGKAPTFAELSPRLIEILANRTVIAYNAPFDRRMLDQTARQCSVRLPLLTWECAMQRYAQYIGRPSSRRGGHGMPRLPRNDDYRGKKHQAVDDCLATLDLIRRMAVVS
jgi:DNA polymerase-3 subunit epsilon